MKTKHLLRKLLTIQENEEGRGLISSRIPDSIYLSDLINALEDIKDESTQKKLNKKYKEERKHLLKFRNTAEMPIETYNILTNRIDELGKLIGL